MRIKFERVRDDRTRGSYYSYNMITVLSIRREGDLEDEAFEKFKNIVSNMVETGVEYIAYTAFDYEYIQVEASKLKSLYFPIEFYQLCAENNILSKAELVDMEKRVHAHYFKEYSRIKSASNSIEEWYVKPPQCECCYVEGDKVKEYAVKGLKRRLCEECYKKYYQVCPICGEVNHKGSMKVLDGRLVCIECIDKLRKKYKQSVYWCTYCQEYHTKQRYGKNRCNENEWVCDFAKPKCQVCAGCGMLILCNGNSNGRAMQSFNRQHYCIKCWAKKEKYLIKAYHNDPKPEFYAVDASGKNIQMPSPYNGIGPFYGVELEVDAGGQRDDISEPTIKLLNEEVYAMRDGSLENGFEIVTHPHTEDALYNMNWEETFKYLVKQGYRSHDINTCGLHLHCNRSIFGANESDIKNNVSKLMWFVENNRREFVKLSRREIQHINRWARFYSDEVGETLGFYKNIYEDYNRSSSHDDRYKAINLCKKRTIEFRLMRGTLNIDTFLATLDVLITISKNAMLISNDKISRAELWLNGIKEPTKKYLIENKIFVEELSKEVKPEELIKPKKTRKKKEETVTSVDFANPNIFGSHITIIDDQPSAEPELGRDREDWIRMWSDFCDVYNSRHEVNEEEEGDNE